MTTKFPAIRLQEKPLILLSVIPGRWLLKTTTPSWRIEDPKLGFQRMVNEERARNIAIAVIDQKRSFPNAIVLATDFKDPATSNCEVALPTKIRFLVVDGQHRLWAQKYSDFDAPYSCLIHFGLSERDMAELFVEINDNQKRVPSSLRWDLVRLVRPTDDPVAVRTADLVYDLATTRQSALFQRIDLTGEQSHISLKQGSVAPAVRTVIGGTRSPLKELGYDIQFRVLMNFVAAMRECDADAWDNGTSPLYSARIFRAAFRLLVDIIPAAKLPVQKLQAVNLYKFLIRINLKSLDTEKIRAQQGTAGIKAIYETLRKQVF